jgi:hypothetical protein
MDLNMEVSLENLTSLLTYEEFECSDGTKALNVMWDEENEKLSDIMEYEIRFGNNPCKKRNLLWIEKFKEICNYKQGEELFLYTKQNADGYFNVFKQEKEHFIYGFKIHKDGYAEMFDFISQYIYRPPIGIIVDSLYNDKNTQ